ALTCLKTSSLVNISNNPFNKTLVIVFCFVCAISKFVLNVFLFYLPTPVLSDDNIPVLLKNLAWPALSSIFRLCHVRIHNPFHNPFLSSILLVHCAMAWEQVHSWIS